MNFLNSIFEGWAEENLDEDTDPLYNADPSTYEYATFLNAGRADNVIAAWKEAL